MRVPTALDLIDIPVDLADRLADGALRVIDHAEAGAREHRHVAVFQIHHVARMGENGRHVAGHEPFILADADQQRTAFTRGDDLVLVATRNHGDAVRAFDALERLHHRIFEAAFKKLLDQVRKNFGVGLRREHMAARFKRLLE